jgi:hypothetical protein
MAFDAGLTHIDACMHAYMHTYTHTYIHCGPDKPARNPRYGQDRQTRIVHPGRIRGLALIRVRAHTSGSSARDPIPSTPPAPIPPRRDCASWIPRRPPTLSAFPGLRKGELAPSDRVNVIARPRPSQRHRPPFPSPGRWRRPFHKARTAPETPTLSGSRALSHSPLPGEHPSRGSHVRTRGPGAATPTPVRVRSAGAEGGGAVAVAASVDGGGGVRGGVALPRRPLRHGPRRAAHRRPGPHIRVRPPGGPSPPSRSDAVTPPGPPERKYQGRRAGPGSSPRAARCLRAVLRPARPASPRQRTALARPRKNCCSSSAAEQL